MSSSNKKSVIKRNESWIKIKKSESNKSNKTNKANKSIKSHKSSNKSKIIKDKISTCITGYWEVYTEQNIYPYPLNEVPTYVNNICIAFVAPQKADNNEEKATSWGFDVVNVYSKDQIKKWIKDINNRGTNQGVYFSLLDTPDIYWYPNVNIPEFAKNIGDAVKEYGLAGIDIDAESRMTQNYVDTFVSLIKEIKKNIGDKKIIYTCYTQSQYDSDIIGKCKDEIDLINTMAYWDDLDGMKQIYKHYVNDIGNRYKVGVGVKAGNENIDGSTTKLDTVKDTALWCKQDGHPLMMLWSLTRDINGITTKDDNTYLDTIYNNMNDECDTNCVIL